MATNDQVRFMPTKRFNGHDAGSSFGTSRANAEAWINLGLGHIVGEEPPATGPEAEGGGDQEQEQAPDAIKAAFAVSEEQVAALLDEQYTADELKAYAKDNEIDIKGAKSKPEIIGKVVEHLKSLQGPPQNKQIPEAPASK